MLRQVDRTADFLKTVPVAVIELAFDLWENRLADDEIGLAYACELYALQVYHRVGTAGRLIVMIHKQPAVRTNLDDHID